MKDFGTSPVRWPNPVRINHTCGFRGGDQSTWQNFGFKVPQRLRPKSLVFSLGVFRSSEYPDDQGSTVAHAHMFFFAVTDYLPNALG